MTFARLRELRTAGPVEQRNLPGTYGGNGYAWVDPAAIPPPNFDRQQRAGVLITPHTALQVDVVYTALRIISNSIIKLGKLRCYEDELSKDNIPYRVWQEEQPELLTDMWGGRMLPSVGMNQTVWSMGLFGEAFWLILARDKLQYATALDVLHPAFMEVKADDNGFPRYIYGSGVNKRELPREDVVHVPLKSLPGARRALSPTEYAGTAVALAMAAYEFGSAWFAQGASPSFLLTSTAKLGQEELDRIAEKFMIEKSGLSNAHLPLVLDGGMDAKELMAAPDKAQYLETLEYARSVIFSWFGIEFAYQNALQRSTPPSPGALQEESMRFLQYTLSGYLVPLEEAVSALLPTKKLAAWDESKLTRPSAQALAEEVTSLRQAQAASINDVRTRRLGWPPVDGGDEVLAPLASNTAPGQTSEQSEPEDNKEPDEKESDEKKPPEK